MDRDIETEDVAPTQPSIYRPTLDIQFPTPNASLLDQANLESSRHSPALLELSAQKPPNQLLNQNASSETASSEPLLIDQARNQIKGRVTTQSDTSLGSEWCLSAADFDLAFSRTSDHSQTISTQTSVSPPLISDNSHGVHPAMRPAGPSSPPQQMVSVVRFAPCPEAPLASWPRAYKISDIHSQLASSRICIRVFVIIVLCTFFVLSFVRV